MIAVVDFNGYIDSHNKFVIKEYTLVLLDQNGSEKLKKFGIAKRDLLNPPNIDLRTRLSYHKYYTTHGILWRTGRESQEFIKSTMGNFLHRCYTIFVDDCEKKKLLGDYLKDYFINTRLTGTVSIFPLKNLGFKIKLQNTRHCRKHKGRSKICAKDGVSQMVKFVKHNNLYDTNRLMQIYLIVDFNTYGNNFEGVKELSLIRLDHNGRETDSKTMVTKPPKLSEMFRNYKDFYDKYGIKWTRGDIQSETLRYNLKEMLDHALFIYVKDHNQRTILFEVNPNCVGKIICLDDLGYDAPDEFQDIQCDYHDNPRSNYCAKRNVELMKNWLRRNFERLSCKVDRVRSSLNEAKNIQADPPATSRKLFLEDDGDQLDLHDLKHELDIDDPDAPMINHAFDSTVIEGTGVLRDNYSDPIDIDLELNFDHDIASLDPQSLYTNLVDNLEDYDIDLDQSSDLLRGADVQVNIYQENDQNVRELVRTRTFPAVNPSSPESEIGKIEEFIDDWIERTNDEEFVDTYFVNSPTDLSVDFAFNDVDVE